MALATDAGGAQCIAARVERGLSAGEREELFEEVRRHLPTLVHDLHGNRVVQAYLACGTAAQRAWVYEHALRGNVAVLSLHPSGCRVVQRALEHVDAGTRTAMVRELEHVVVKCVMDQNGNHVVQKCIETAEPPEAVQFMLDAFRGQVVLLARHAYGCRVLQRIIEHCTAAQVAPLVDELLAAVGPMLTDQFGNYVVQHVMERGTARQRRAVVLATRGRVQELSCHKFASNVMEKCVQHCAPDDRNTAIVAELLQGGGAPLFALVGDQYGNYVVQKLLEVCEPPTRDRILAVLRPAVPTLEQLPYGKHIIQCVAKYDPSLAPHAPSPRQAASASASAPGGAPITTSSGSSGSGSGLHSPAMSASAPQASPGFGSGSQRRAQHSRHRQSHSGSTSTSTSSGSTSPYLAASIDIGGSTGAHVRGRSHRSSGHASRSSSSTKH